MSSHKYTYYQVLGLQPAVSSLEIKQAYRRLVKSLHPDIAHKHLTNVQQVHANERMAKLNAAYETLKDKSSRAAYDSLIGVNGRGNSIAKGFKFPLDNSAQAREQYLQQVLYPERQKISHVLSKYKKQLARLSEDIYDYNHLTMAGNLFRESNDLSKQALNLTRS